MGFLSLIPAKVWEILAAVLALAAFGAYMYHRGGVGPEAELAAEKATFAAFQAQTRQLGETAQKAADARTKADQLAKENADAQAAKSQADLDRLYAAYRKLRQSTASSSSANSLSAAPTFTPSSPRSCFDSAKFVAAMGILEAGVPGITYQGDSAIGDLNAAKGWAKDYTK